MKRIAIIGGGVAGLSAAQELLDRGFAVDIYELNDIPGGKARSFDVPETEYSCSANKKPLPAEHGFRFFPGFYRHLVETMRRIPVTAKQSVADNLVNIDRLNYARFGKDITAVPIGNPRTLRDIARLLRLWLGKNGVDMPLRDLLRYGWRIFRLFSSCDARVKEQYEQIGWWDFIQADKGSELYRRYFANGSRILVAADPRKASTRTNGMIMEQLIRDQAKGNSDRVLSGPTNATWIFPWVKSLVSHPHCRFFVNARVTDIGADRDNLRVTGFKVTHRDGETATFSQILRCDNHRGPLLEPLPLPIQPSADYYIAAVPVEVMAGYVGTDGQWSVLAELDENLRKLDALRHHLQWMNGVVFYLKGQLRTVAGHSVYVDTPYAISSIFHGRLWDNSYRLDNYGRGNLTAICSAIISNWSDTEDCRDGDICHIPFGGRGRIHGLSALATIENNGDFTAGKDRLIDEMWQDIKDSLWVDGKPLINDDNFEFAYIDPAIHSQDGVVKNREPLLVNRKNGWHLRPDAETNIENFFLAGDYVKTHTDLATMEGACEAAKRAVNGILAREQAAVQLCTIYPLERLRGFAPLRFIDKVLYKWHLVKPRTVLGRCLWRDFS